MEICKKCGSAAFTKNGFVREKQRYLCKVCGRNQTDGDGREKYSEAVRNTAATLYLEVRQIERVLRRIYSIKIHGS